MSRLTISLAMPICIIAICFAMSGCGGGATTEPTVSLKSATLDVSQDDEKIKGPEKTVDVAGAGPGNIIGQILFEGTPPALSPKVAQGAAVRDAEVCSASPVPNEALVVGDNGGVANVFVYLASAPRGYQPGGTLEPVKLDQKGCQFRPHALLSQVGQAINVVNSDAAAHNTNIGFVRNKKFNSTINANDEIGVMIEPDKKENQPVKTVCDFHAWMDCYVFVVDHPFAAVTDANGNFEIKGLPPGKHKFRVWHESADFLETSLTIEVKPGADTKVDKKYDSTKFSKLF